MLKAYRPVPTLLRRSALWAAISLTFAVSAQALTLGRPQVQSKIGEPLKADISITQVSPDEETGLQAEMAEAELYRSLQMELPQSGNKALDLQVKLERRDNGQFVLRLSSQQVVTRRDMDILLRMRWATGQLLRNVSISMDDASSPRPLISPLPPGTASAPASAAAVKAASSLPVPDKSGSKNKAPARDNAAADKAKSGDRVEVQRGDTASEIVVKSMPGGVSLDQMLVALLRNNPDAFVDNNVNRLKAGALLALPSASDAKEISREDAREEMLFQTQNFHAYRAELAARAGRTEIAKAERSSEGKLQAQVQNKSSKANQDKLTLSKPKDAKAEDKIVQQRQAQDVAQQAAELSRNVSELGKLANEAAGAAVGEGVNLPQPTQSNANAWLDELTQNPLTPVGAGALIALMVVLGLLRRHQRNRDNDIEGLPPLNVKFDLDLPDRIDGHPDDRHHDAHGHAHESHGSPAGHDHGHDHAHAHADGHHHDNHGEHGAHAPTLHVPDVSLDLGNASHHPLQVRMDLAEELWKLGQLHTSRALMEEVAQEASGELQAKALQWLAERS
jgi:FimV-like protein